MGIISEAKLYDREDILSGSPQIIMFNQWDPKHDDSAGLYDIGKNYRKHMILQVTGHLL